MRNVKIADIQKKNICQNDTFGGNIYMRRLAKNAIVLTLNNGGKMDNKNKKGKFGNVFKKIIIYEAIYAKINTILRNLDKVKETDLVEINDIIYKILKSNKIIKE